MKSRWLILPVLFLLILGMVNASGLSTQLKRTNPGVAGEKAATLIFDVVNTDMEHKMQGFIWCQSPDDTTITSTLGAETGTGAQYVSPLFYMDKGPSQNSMTLTVESDSTGDKSLGCIVKYVPYIEKPGTGGETVKLYQKMNGEEVTTVTDMDYREIRLDKTVPFVEGMEEPVCPQVTSCTKSEVVEKSEAKIEESPSEEKPSEPLSTTPVVDEPVSQQAAPSSEQSDTSSTSGGAEEDKPEEASKDMGVKELADASGEGTSQAAGAAEKTAEQTATRQPKSWWKKMGMWWILIGILALVGIGMGSYGLSGPAIRKMLQAGSSREPDESPQKPSENENKLP